MNPDNELRPNGFYYGLDKKSCKQLSHWHHFRSPQTEKGRQKIESEKVVFTVDFLDSLEEDLPTGVWSLQLSVDETAATCRNLLWPGYSAFHRLGTSIFGSTYIGNGIKNIDLAFML